MNNSDNSNENQGRIQIRSKPKLNILIQSYYFYEFVNEFDLQQNPHLFQNISNSEIVIINKYQINDNDLFFIISFQNTIIIIKQSLIQSLIPLFLSKPELTFYYFQDTKTIFNQQIQNLNFQIKTQIEFDGSKDEEIENFNSQLIAFNIMKFEYPEMYSNIKMSISSYLIEESYNKLNQDQIIDFSKYFTNQNEKENENEKEINIEKWKDEEYIDLKIIGSGSSSSVKLVYQIEEKKLYAIKMQTPIYNDNEEYYKREFKNYLRLNYPLLPKLYGIYKMNDIFYLKIQYIKGETLLNSGKFQTISFENKIFIILQLLLIINYFHKKGFVYRDLKPNNIIIDKNNTVFVIDFDRMISEIDDKDKTHTLQFGIYSAPEVNCGIITTKNDIYSLGKMIYYILDINNNTNEIENKEIESMKNNCQIFIEEDPNKRPSISDILYDFNSKYIHQINNLPIQYTPEIQYFQGLIHIEKDIKSGIQFLISSANQNYLDAQLLLGIIYYDDKYITRDIDKSIYYYTLAANQNADFKEFSNKNIKQRSCIQRSLSGYLIQQCFQKTNICFENEQDTLELKNLFFNDITEKCHNILLNKINNEIIQNIYSKFSFMYYLFDSNSANFFISFLPKYLNEYKFFTYEFLEDSISIPFFQNNEIVTSTNLIDVIICVEKECIIIKQIDKTFIQQILTETKAAFINTNLKTSEDECVKEEILNFTQHYRCLIDTNDFIKCTINPIVGYLIRRYFYPSNFFNDQSFFKFEKSSENSREDVIQTRLYDIIVQTNKKEEMNEKLQQFQEDLIEQTKHTENNCELNSKIHEFNSKDFHVLRTIHTNSNSSLTLVIHIKSLYLFVCKNIISENLDEFKHEIDFKLNYSHRCLTRFYGFVKNQDKIIGLVYEFMSNGSLLNYISSNDNLFSFMTVVRIFEGIKYLHSKSLIHQYIEPSNILLDHNFLPYISNYKYVSYENKIDQNFIPHSLLYSSPEQFFNKEISFSTDIYSFGALIYFLFEKKDMIPLNSDEIYDLIRDEQLPEMTNVSSSIQFIYLSCVRYESEERLTLNDIEQEIINEINSFCYIENFLKNENNNHNKIELIQYFNEIILFQSRDIESFQTFINNFLNFDLFSLFLSLSDFSTVLLNLGKIYFEGKIVQQNFLTAKSYYELSSELNNSKAYNSLGFLYLNGLGVMKDYTKSFEYFESSAKLDNAFGYVNVGILYASGLGVEKDINKAEEYFEKMIKLKDPQAMNYLGDYYTNGQFVEKNYEKAKKYFELASQYNYPEGQFNLGIFYYYGFYFEKNIEKSKAYFELAAQQNQPNALFMLGCLYLNGESVKQDYSKAIYYFKKSAQFNFLNAILQLGDMYLFGQGVEKDANEAIKYYEIAGKLNCADAYFAIGCFYNNGLDIKQDLVKAREYYEKASKLGNSDALNILGDYYLNGICVKQDYKKAFEYFNLAADMNNYRAHYYLGIIYMNAYGVQQNYIEARKHFKLAAEKNDASSQFNLGNIYLNGFGVQQDVAIAKNYFELAAKQNHSDALFNLGTFHFAGIGVAQDIPKAINYFELSSQNGNKNASFILATFYSEGEFVEKDLNKSLEYFEKSGQLNDPNTLLYLGYKSYINQDYTNALHFCESAAKNNCIGALFLLGIMYLNGEGVIKDIKKAKEYFKQSTKSNNPMTFLFLGMIYLNEKTTYNHSKSNEYFEKFFKLFKNNNTNQYLQNYLNQFKSFNMFGINMQLQNQLNTFSDFFNKKTKSQYNFIIGYLYYNGIGIEKNFTKAKEYLELAAEQLHPEACEYLGNIYCIEENLSKAKKYLKIAAKEKNQNAYKTLACIYYIEHNYKKTIEYLKLGAQLNDSYAITCLGCFYYQGLGIDRNYSTAKKLYEIAAKLNNSFAIFYIGNLYFSGQGVEKSYSTAKKYFEIAASMGNLFAINSLGNLYFFGKGVERDYKEAKRLFESIKNKLPQGLISLGIMYANGIGVVKDLPKAKYYFKLASKSNNSNAFYSLGCFYYSGKYGKVNYKKAYKYFKIAAEQNHFCALYTLGEMHSEGQGVKKDYLKAKYYYEFAAQFGFSFAYVKLGMLYLNGLGVDKNFEKAKCYLEIAVERNIHLALYYLGHIFISCEFVDMNITKAVDYFKKCVDISDDKFIHIFESSDCIPYDYEINIFKYISYNNLGLIYLTAFNKINDAFEFMKIPAYAEFPFSQNNLGLIYQFYLNEIEKAVHMYKRSSEHKFPLAEFNLGFINEKENNIEKAFEHYEKASEFQNEKIIFHNKVFIDRKLIISTTFIICYTDLKLTEFYFSKNDFEKAKKYFIKSLSKFIFADIYPFNFKFNKNEIEKSFSYIKDFIFNFPLFDFENHENLNLNNFRKLNDIFFIQNIKTKENQNKETKKSEMKISNKKIDSFVKKEEKLKILNENEINVLDINDSCDDIDSLYHKNQLVFEDPGDLFDFVIQQNDSKVDFIEEIKNIIQTMKKIIYTPPYFILFGTINIKKCKLNQIEQFNPFMKNIDESFYEGFDVKF